MHVRARLRRLVAVILAAGMTAAVAGLAATGTPAVAANPGANGLIVYAAFLGGTPGSQIFAVDPAGGAVQDLSGSVYGDDQPAVSPGGDEVAFRHNGAIWVMNIDGSARHEIGGNGSEGHPSWSPAGTSLAFDTDARGDGFSTGGPNIWTMTADGGNATQLTTDNSSSDPAWAPDGSKIAYVDSQGGNKDIFAISPTGGAGVDLTGTPNVDETAPDWAPDASRIVYTSTDLAGHGKGTVGPDLWTMAADGSDQTPLLHHQYSTDLISDGADPAWSPDGTQIAFAANNGTGGIHVWRVAAGGGQDVQVTSEPGNPGDQNVSWQPLPTGSTTSTTVGSTSTTVSSTTSSTTSSTSTSTPSTSTTSTTVAPPTTTIPATTTTAPATTTTTVAGPRPQIRPLLPDRGPTGGGTQVVLPGSNLANVTTVLVDGTPVPFRNLPLVGLVFTTPPHAAGPVSVTTTGPTGASNAETFTYVASTPVFRPPVPAFPTPHITGLSPTSEPQTGGDSITVNGDNLNTVVQVLVDGVPVHFTLLTRISSGFLGIGQDTSLVVVFDAPPHAPGPATVTLVGLTGASSNPATLTYTAVAPPRITGISPSTARQTGGDTITVNGDRLNTVVQVLVDGQPVHFSVDTTISGGFLGFGQTSTVVVTFTAPSHAPGPATVTLVGQTGTSNPATLTYTAVAPPRITSLSPSTARTAGGDRITVNGERLDTVVQVLVDGVPVHFSVDTLISGGFLGFGTQTTVVVTFDAPPHAPGGATVTLVGQTGTSNPATLTYRA